MIITRKIGRDTYISGEFDVASYIGYQLSKPFGAVLVVFITAWLLDIPFQEVIDVAKDIFSLLYELWENL